MSKQCWTPLARRAGLLGVAALVATGMAIAQSAASSQAQPNSTNSLASSPASSSWSDSNSSMGPIAELAAPQPMPALPSAPAPSASAAGSAAGGGGILHDAVSHLAIEAGGGVNAPAGDKAYITWGGQFVIGGGIQVNPHFAGLLEYQFIDDKLPGKLIAETGATGGHDHIWSITLDPVFDLLPKASNDAYVTGGFGFYRKVTSFTDLEPEEFCEYFYCGEGYAPETVGHFSSNQGGFNIGGGYLRHFGGIYGTSKTAFFAEVRYLDVLSPALTSEPNGLGTISVGKDTKVLPISFGIRW